jgi:hypothetical protein
MPFCRKDSLQKLSGLGSKAVVAKSIVYHTVPKWGSGSLSEGATIVIQKMLFDGLWVNNGLKANIVRGTLVPHLFGEHSVIAGRVGMMGND